MKLINAFTLGDDEAVIINEIPIDRTVISALNSLVSMDTASALISAITTDLLFLWMREEENIGNEDKDGMFIVSETTKLLTIELIGLLTKHSDLKRDIRLQYGATGSMSSFVSK